MPGEHPEHRKQTPLLALQEAHCTRAHKSSLGYVHLSKHVSPDSLHVDLSLTATSSRMYPFLRFTCATTAYGISENESLLYRSTVEIHAKLGTHRVMLTIATASGTFSSFSTLVKAALDAQVGEPSLSVQECIVRLQTPKLVEETLDRIAAEIELPVLRGDVFAIPSKIHLRNYGESGLLLQAKRSVRSLKELSSAG